MQSNLHNLQTQLSKEMASNTLTQNVKMSKHVFGLRFTPEYDPHLWRISKSLMSEPNKRGGSAAGCAGKTIDGHYRTRN